jgi:hypothetical protein
MTLKAIAIAIAAAVLAFFAGWLTGSAGKASIETARTESELQAQVATARADLLEGRVSVLLTNFGDAVSAFQRARTDIGRLQNTLRESSQSERAGRLEIVISHLSDAERLAVALDRRSQDAAGEALKALQAATDN